MFVNFISSLNVLLYWFPADQGLKKVNCITFLSELKFRMILSKLVIKTLLCYFILNNHVTAVYLLKNKWINWRQGVDISDDVTTTKAIRGVNDKMF